MKKINFLALWIVLVLNSPFIANAQCMMYEIPLNNRVQNSSFIFEGKVIAQKSFWNPAHTLIYTSHLIEVYKVFKGKISTSQIELINQGGTVGYDMHVITPNLKLTIGEVGVFFAEVENSLPGAFSSPNEKNPIKGKKISPSKSLTSSSLPKFKIYASAQGFIRYNIYEHSGNDPFKKYNDIKTDIYNTLAQYTNQPYKEIKIIDVYQSNIKNNHLPAPSISSFTPTTITAGTFDTITINGSNFGATQGTSNVAFSNADDAGATIVATGFTSDYISWSNTQIKAIVHDQAGTGSVYVNVGAQQGSKAGLTIPYAQSIISSGGNPFESNLINKNGLGGYTYKYSTNTSNGGISFAAAANDSAKARFQDALTSWNCNTGFNVIVSGTTALGPPAASDGTSVVTYDNNANALSAGTLGTGYSYYSSCNGTDWYVNEIDITFKRDGTGVTWYFGYNTASQPGGSSDFQSVALHESGHTHQMGHVINTSNTMHYQITNGTNRRTLLTDNINCGNYIMGHSTPFSACSKTGMTDFSCTAPPVADFSGTPTSASCAPLTVNFTDESTYTPTSWKWYFGDGDSSTSQNPSHNYTSSGNYTVRLIATNANGSDDSIKTNYITISSTAPTANFSGTPTSGSCLPVTVNFTDSSSPTPTSWKWYFGDGDSSTSQNPSHNYTSTGAFTVQLIATNCNGSDDSIRTNYINISTTPPVANFSATPVSGCSPLSVNFTDLSTQVPTTWKWYFGDGDSSTSQNPSHNYASIGSYNVRLIATNCNGSDDTIRNGYVNVSNPTAASCTPNTIQLGGNYAIGIYNFTFNTINKSTGSAYEDGGYQNFTCTNSTTVDAGKDYSVSVTTGTFQTPANENVKIYIDFNNNGNLEDAGELVFTSDDVLTNHSGTITIACSPTLNTLLRMRVLSDWTYYPINNSCDYREYGQAEDYGIIIVKNSSYSASAGSDQTLCSTTATLAGNTPPGDATGNWSLISGTATITTPSSPTSGLTGLGVGANTLKWSIITGSCTQSSDTVVITRDAAPTTASAGNDQSVCGTSATMAGNTPSVGTGNWTMVSGSGTITTPSSPTTTITSLGAGANSFKWTISNSSCTASKDTVIITSNPSATVTWDGSTSTDWNTASNWDVNYVPNSCSDVVIPNTTNKPTLSTTGYCNTINIQSSSGAVLTISGGSVLNVSQ